MDADRLKKLLKECFIEEVVFLEEIDSTNNHAKELLTAEKIEKPFLVLAEKQTAGRGRGKNQWWSAQGALTFSIVIEPTIFSIPKENWPLISIATAVAISSVIEERITSQRCQLKWPNDVYLDEMKLAGILVEVPSTQPESVIVGVGINVNNSLKNAPVEIQQIGISMYDVLGETIDRMELLKSLLYHFENEFNQLAANPDRLISYWRERCYLTHRIITIEHGPESVTGTCQGIDDDGGIQLITETGLKKFHGGIVQSVE